MSRSRGDELETTTSAEMRRLAGEVDSMRARHKDEVSEARFYGEAPVWFPMILVLGLFQQSYAYTHMYTLV